jgi:predicted HD phosphohydrolase
MTPEVRKTIGQIYQTRGNSDYIGEPVSQIEHALQTGYQALRYMCTQGSWERNPVGSVGTQLRWERSPVGSVGTQLRWGQSEVKPTDLIVAGVLHDIGHLVTSTEMKRDISDMMTADKSWGRTGHEILGAEFLRDLGLPEPIPTLVGSHVNAKRYRVWKDPAYAARLSEASTMTLKFQGGPMTDAEGDAFEQDPLCQWKLKLREWDEAAKEPNQTYGPINIIQCLERDEVPSVIPDLESVLNLI